MSGRSERIDMCGMSVRVVPSLEEVVAREYGDCFELKCNGDELEWAETLVNCWRVRRAPLPELDRLFASSSEPFATAIRVAVRCGDNQRDFKPKTLPHTVIERLKRWVLKTDTRLQPGHVQFVAFSVAAEQKNASFVNLIVETYRLKELGDTLLPHVRSLVTAHNYKTASHFAVALDLDSHFTLEELIVPLFLQDKIALVEELLDKRPGRAVDFIKYLDELVKHKNVVQQIHIFLTTTQVPDIKWDKMYLKPIGKLIVRLCKKYSVATDTCENLAHMRAYRGVRFLVRQKYDNDSPLSKEAWGDLIEDALVTNPLLVKEVVSMVAIHDPNEALNLAKKYRLPECNYPDELTTNIANDKLNNIHLDNVTHSDRAHSNDTNLILDYYTLRVLVQDVKIVNERHMFDFALNHLSGIFHCVESIVLQISGVRWKSLPSLLIIQLCECKREAKRTVALVSPLYNWMINGDGSPIVGLDSEWKPSFGTKPSSVSLIQMASTYKVFIFDVLALNAQHESNLWPRLSDAIFNNTNIVKLGFGIDFDMKEIISTVPGLSSVKYKGFGYLDLGQLWKNIASVGIQLPYPKVSSGEGLNSIVEQCFGKCLNKDEQCSNWENRPLRDSQIKYAALDAHVLIEIYQLFSDICAENNVNFEEICYQIMEKSGFSKIKKKYMKEKNVNKTNDNPNSS